jgi:hypothetical protein
VGNTGEEIPVGCNFAAISESLLECSVVTSGIAYIRGSNAYRRQTNDFDCSVIHRRK